MIVFLHFESCFNSVYTITLKMLSQEVENDVTQKI